MGKSISINFIYDIILKSYFFYSLKNYVPYETGAEGNLGALVLVHEALDLLLPSYKPTNRNPNPTGEETPTPTNVPAFEMQDM